MKSIRTLQSLFPVLAFVFVVGCSQAIAQQTGSFTYQGQLRENGTNANGTYALIFKLYDSASGGTQKGSAITNNTSLINGLFSVKLDFGASVFDGGARWLEIAVQSGGSVDTLAPREQLTPAPYALYATVAGTVANGAITNSQVVKSLNGLTDVVTLSAGTNMILSTSGNVLQLSASSNVVSTPEARWLSVTRGSIGKDGTIEVGSGNFTVSYAPAGSGGDFIHAWANGSPDAANPGTFNAAQGFSTLTGGNANLAGVFSQPNQYVLIGGGFYQVASWMTQCSSPDPTNCSSNLTLVQKYEGSTGPVIVTNKMRLYPEYTITYATPFLSEPVVVATVHSDGTNSAFAPRHYYINVETTSSADARLGFRAIVGRPDSLDKSSPGFNERWDFIAIGPR